MLTFEWILLVTIVVIGVVGGLSAVRDAIVDELGDVAIAVVAVDQSYEVLTPLDTAISDCTESDGGVGFGFADDARYGKGYSNTAPQVVVPCGPQSTDARNYDILADITMTP